MRRSLFPSDDSLPTWLHTLLLLLVVSPFSIFLLWHGGQAITTAYLAPLAGPELGQFFFGPHALHGKAATIAGIALIVLGFAFIALAFNYSRVVRMNKVLRLLPWIMIALYAAMSFWVRALS